MMIRSLIIAHWQLIIFFFACTLPISANSTTEEEIPEKRIKVTMRTIGHKVLTSLGDDESRVLSIKRVVEKDKTLTYRIPFETDFGFDPGEIISIVYDVMTETGTSSNYLVEVEQCETKDIVHSFEIRNATNPNLISCRGRKLPVDCYSLLVTILDATESNCELAAVSTSPHIGPPFIEFPPGSEHASTPPATETFNLANSFYIFVPLLSLIAFIGFFFNKKEASSSINSNLIPIGASRFDTRNSTLTFEDKSVELSNKEAELLSLLHSSANAPLKREVILHRVWGDEGDYVGRTLDVFISKLRKKLEADKSVKIVNIRGVGYKLVM